MISGFPPCEGEGPDLSAVYLEVRVTGCPLIIHINGQKGYTIDYAEGMLLLVDSTVGQQARETFEQLIPLITGDCVAGILEGDTELSWQITRPTAESFRAWAASATTRWILQQQLQDAIIARDVKAIKAAIDAGADVNAETPNGIMPLMAAAQIGDVQTVGRLLDYGRISDQQWYDVMQYAQHHCDATIQGVLRRPCQVG